MNQVRLIRSKENRVIETEEDIVLTRNSVKRVASLLGFNTMAQTKVVTAASELARNTFEHGGGGTVQIAVVEEGQRIGLELTFQDHGKGIPDIDQAMRDGFSTVRGMGLGLGGSRRLMDDFEIDSFEGRGTTITTIKWL